MAMLFIAVLWKFRSKDRVFSFFFFFAHYDVLFPCLKKMEFFLFATNSGSVFYTAVAVKAENRWVLFLRYINHSSSLFTVFFSIFCGFRFDVKISRTPSSISTSVMNVMTLKRGWKTRFVLIFLNTTRYSIKCNEYEFSKNVHQAVIIWLNICLVFFFCDLQSGRIFAVLSLSYPTLIPRSSPTPGTNKRGPWKRGCLLPGLC